MLKKLIVVALISSAGCAFAATDTAGMNKQQLVDRVLQLWHVDALGEAMLQQPVADAVQQARAVLQGRVVPARQDAALKEISADARKFMDENSPLVRTTTQKLAPSTIGPLLSARFNDEELRQIIAILESPVRQKFEAALPELNKALGEKLAADMQPTINPKLNDLKQRIGLRLRTAIAQ
ncbi:DUF2059 domain-containing protein [Oxalobacteraceae bacterium OM1]|nr:DUF2059 domain-containing protein [Oxalobacteraceae bacterium OM1]